MCHPEIYLPVLALNKQVYSHSNAAEKLSMLSEGIRFSRSDLLPIRNFNAENKIPISDIVAKIILD